MFRKIAFLTCAIVCLTGAATAQRIDELVAAGSLEQAFAVAEKAADKGDAEGDQALGQFYSKGLVVLQNDKKAAQHFRSCAKAGLKHCQWQFGVMMDLGQGVDQDPKDAFTWLQKSAAQNYDPAFVSLGAMYATGRGTDVDYAKSMEAYRTGAKLGNAHGFYGVGVLHAAGEGVPKDLAAALSWFIVAHFQGDGEATAYMNQLAPGFSPDVMQKIIARANDIQREFGLIKTPQADVDKIV
jgi:TPR repeat protein